MRLSVCMIVKDEQEVLARCLDSVKKFADQIIIVDTGSTDETVEIAKKYTDEIHFFKWCDDFSAARNYAFEKADGDYLMWLDADDVITDLNVGKIIELKNSPDFDLAFFKYCSNFENDRPTLVYYRERVVKKSKNYKFVGAVHEVIIPSGKTVYCDIEIHHKKIKTNQPFRNLFILQKQLAMGVCLDERQKFYLARELFFNNQTVQAIAVYTDFLSGDGWVENKIQACIDLYYAYSSLKKDDLACEYLLKSLSYGFPKPQTCCILGEMFLNKGDNNSAIFWYTAALNGKDKIESGGFCNLDYCGFIPYMQLCHIYDKMGEHKLSAAFNDLAGKLKPEHPAYLKNKSYFNWIFKGQN